MCGIAGLHVKPHARGKFNVGWILDELLLGIESRGKDATGFVAVSFEGDITLDKINQPASTFVTERRLIPGTTQTVLGHTRLATQGVPEINANNHPVQFGPMFVTHNGHISNDWELFREKDITATAQVDSEIIPALLYKEGSIDKPEKVLETLEGAMAIAALDVRQPEKLLLARGASSPLVIVETANIIMWASTENALREAWGKTIGTPPSKAKFQYVPEGMGYVIEHGVMESFTFEPNDGWSGYSRFVYSSDYGHGTRRSRFAGAATTYKEGIGADDGRPGYWLYDDNGEREYHSVVTETGDDFWSANAASGGTGYSTSDLPSKTDWEIVESLQDWAEQDSQIHDEAIMDLAQMCEMSAAQVMWLLFFADEDYIKSDPAVERVVNYMAREYKSFYGDAWIKEADERASAKRAQQVAPVLCEALENASSENEYAEIMAASQARALLEPAR